MKIAFLITSSIDVENIPLTYSNTRSIFTAEERFKQTILTIESINKIRNSDSKIYLVDSSKNWDQYKSNLNYKNFQYVSIQKEFPDIYAEVRSHANKSRCETLATLNFLQRYKNELNEFDAIIKISGRYFLDISFDVGKISRNCIVFKYPWKWNWRDEWNYQMVKLPEESKLHQYCTMVFGWGMDHFDNILNLYTEISDTLSDPNNQHYDMETLIYFYSRKIRDYIVETDWPIYGWLGTTGKFSRY